MLSPSSSKRTAAVPPSADTECERITWSFETIPILIFGFFLAASIAALRPANPEPHIIKSNSIDSTICQTDCIESGLNM